MELIVELILQFIGEVLLQIVIEALVELGWHSLAAATLESRPHPVLSGIGHTLLGLMAGGLSLWLSPHLMMKTPATRLANLILTPIVAGLAMSALGAWRRSRGQELLRLDRFAYAYLFAFSMAVMRFTFGS